MPDIDLPVICPETHDFACRVFGRKSYLCDDEFKIWSARGGYFRSFLVRSADGRVASIIQSIHGAHGDIGVESFFNYATLSEWSGAGLKHLARVRKSDNFFIPAVSDPNLSKSYERFGARRLSFVWGRRILVPRISLKGVGFWLRRDHLDLQDVKLGVSITNKIFKDEVWSRLKEAAAPIDEEFLRWRLESKGMSRVFKIQNLEGPEFLLAVVGKRRGIPVVRVIYASGKSDIIEKLCTATCAFGAKMGAMACFFCLPEQLARVIVKDSKYKVLQSVNTYIKSTSNNITEDVLMLYGDVGLQEQFGG